MLLKTTLIFIIRTPLLLNYNRYERSYPMIDTDRLFLFFYVKKQFKIKYWFFKKPFRNNLLLCGKTRVSWWQDGILKRKWKYVFLIRWVNVQMFLFCRFSRIRTFGQKWQSCECSSELPKNDHTPLLWVVSARHLYIYLLWLVSEGHGSSCYYSVRGVIRDFLINSGVKSSGSSHWDHMTIIL